MTPDVVAERARHVAAVRSADAAASGDIKAALVATRQIRAWADAQEASLIVQLGRVEAFCEPTIAEAGKCSLGKANQATERAATLDATPLLADALADGAITAGHVDALTRGSKQLNDDQRDALFDRANELADVAAAATVEEFQRRVKLEIKNLQADDGLDRLQRQRANVRVNTWTDADGMWNMRGTFDPVTGVTLASKLEATINACFAESVPEFCPTDPVEKQKFLAGHAVIRLVDGEAGSSRSGRPEYVVVIDADAPTSTGPTAEWPIPVEIPARVIAELVADAKVDVVGVVVRNGVIVHAPGELRLGRTTRLANTAQRRALRALYSGCAIPGCSVRYDRCKLHHVVWWRHGGRTDLDNLLPLCARHHANVHHDDWVIELGNRRELTVRFPDGTVRSTGPPRPRRRLSAARRRPSRTHTIDRRPANDRDRRWPQVVEASTGRQSFAQPVAEFAKPGAAERWRTAPVGAKANSVLPSGSGSTPAGGGPSITEAVPSTIRL